MLLPTRSSLSTNTKATEEPLFQALNHPCHDPFRSMAVRAARAGASAKGGYYARTHWSDPAHGPAATIRAAMHRLRLRLAARFLGP